MRSKSIYFIVILLVSSSCARRNLVYFSDIDSQSGYSIQVEDTIEPVIQPDDLLKITVSSLNPESNLLFNSGILQPTGNVSTNAVSQLNEGYLVDKGMIPMERERRKAMATSVKNLEPMKL